ncbi:MAG: hypothetical protein HY748_16170 [Elusimicrobia bacterium]|nr:hypothetical protein [Elusimicrobiota bacterium]
MTRASRWLATVLLSLAGQALAANVQVRTVPVLTPGIAPLGAAAVASQRGFLGPLLPSAPALPGIAVPDAVLPDVRLAPVVDALPTAVPVLAPSVLQTEPLVLAKAAPQEAVVPASRLASLGLSLADVERAQAVDPSGVQASLRLDALYSGLPTEAQASVEAGGFAVNGEGVTLLGRAADYYRRSLRIVEKYQGRLDLSESLDVMSDSYGDVWAKIKAIEALGRGSGRNNTHLEQTLTWVDGVMTDHGRNVAIHTHRVFFHHAKNPKSEIAEGIRRADRYLKDTLFQFVQGGKAEAELGRFQEVLLVFDTRGYAEIKDHLKAREAEIRKAGLKRYRFAFLDEMARMPSGDEEMRAELNAMTKRYKGKDLEKIIEGVTYGRYVGLLLELATIDHYMTRGWSILQSGRELFDREGMYITEIDVVARSPQGKVSLVEAKSARVPLPFEEVLRDKVAAKLETYSKNRKLLESSIGAPIDEVVFSFDVGANSGLAAYLQKAESGLSKKYGFTVRFLFLKMDEAGGGARRASRRHPSFRPKGIAFADGPNPILPPTKEFRALSGHSAVLARKFAGALEDRREVR